MRHRQSRLRLRQKPDHARSMVRNLVTSVLFYESVRTTKKRALVVRPVVERLITIARTKEPHNAVRILNAVVTHRNASRKVMEVLRERYRDRPSGFTRVVPAGSRKGDGAELVDLVLVEGTGDRGQGTGDGPQSAAPSPQSSARKKNSKTKP